MTFEQVNRKDLISTSLSINLLLPLLLVSSSGLQLIGHPQVNSVEVNQGYVPPAGRGRLQRTEGSGSRGCSHSLPIELNLLTPRDHVPATVSPRPTFLWHISGQMPVMLVFALVEPGVTEPLLEQQLKVDRSGIVRLRLPSSSPQLAIGKEYRWTVSAICNKNRPSENLYARAWIERVGRSAELEGKLKSSSTPQEAALAYASSNIWYDALAILYDESRSNSQPQGYLANNYFLQLLNQVGLSQVVTQERQRLSTHFKLKAK